jgi:hypothetical protein
MDKRLMAFALGDVFEIYSPKKRFNANAVQFGGKYPYVARGSSNNGIRGYITEDVQYLSPAKSLSFGQDTATVFYQPDAYFTGDKIKVMVLRNHELNDELAQYFITVITKAFSTFAWGQSSFNEKILKDTKIVLPVIESPDHDHEYTVDDIDFEYMQERIAELEQERIAELEQERIAELDAYLAASGLDDYELTDEDKEILSLSPESASDEAGASEADFGNGQVRFKKFALGTLFTSSTGDVDLQQKDINGKGEFFINSGVENRGIKGRTDRPARVFPANTITVDFWGNAYYRDSEYKMATHNHVFSLTGDVIRNRLAGMYIVGILSKLPKLFSYNNMATWNKLKGIEVSLPVTLNGDIDFDYMERYIRAIEKLAIADVAKYKDKLIAATKQVVGM